MTRPTPVPNVKELLAVLRERHGLDHDTVAAMAFERSRQQKVTLTQASRTWSPSWIASPRLLPLHACSATRRMSPTRP